MSFRNSAAPCALLIGAWVAGVIAIAVFGVLSGALATAVTEWIGRLF